MKIGLIAPEKNGKTSYLVALYAVLVQIRSSQAGYPFKFYVDDPKQRKWLNNQFGQLIDEALPLESEEGGNQRFPRKTSDEVTNYVLSIRERDTSFSEKITLVDFPGSIIRGVMSEAQSDLYRATMKELSACDAFIVLLDAEWLLSANPLIPMYKLSPSDLEGVIRAAIESAGDRQFTSVGVPVAFCVSKADKIARLYSGEQRERESVYERVKELFPSFFEDRHRNPVMIVSVSLGEHIERSLENDALGGPFEPFLIEKPFEFCVTFGTLSAMTNQRRDKDKWDRLARSENAKLDRAKGMGFWATVGEWFSTPAAFGESPSEYWEKQRDISRRISHSRTEEANKYKNVIATFLKHLREPVADSYYSIYFGGKHHKIGEEISPGKLPLEPEG